MAAIKFGWLDRIYKPLMYSDSMWVWRQQKITNNDWEYTDSIRPDIYDRQFAIIKNQPCRISLSNYPDTTKDANQYNIPEDWQAKIFFSPGVKLLGGDWVEVERGETGEIYSGAIGDLLNYPSHWEVYMRIDRNA